MKKHLLFFLLLVCVVGFGQSSDSCAEAELATAITAGLHSVAVIDGVAPPSNKCDGVTYRNPTKTEWFKYVPSEDHSLIITSDIEANGNIDTRVNVYSGDCANLVCVGGDDDSGVFLGTSGESFLSYAVMEVTSGVTYYIVWDNSWSDTGFQFQLIENDPKPDSTVVPVSFTSQSASLLGNYDRGLFDVNGDFLDDIVAVNIDNSIGVSELHTNLQNEDGSFTNVVKSTPTNLFPPTWSLSAGDYNADGYNDLMYGSSSGVTFLKTSQTGNDGYNTIEYLDETDPNNIYSQRTNFVDINNDGNLDAFSCEETRQNISFINDGSNTLVFDDSNSLAINTAGGNYASIWIDFDNDRDLDVFVSKCSGFPDPDRKTNELYMNNGDGTFTEIGVSSGLADIQQTWSAAWGDYDNDGDMDVYVGSNSKNDHKIMRNNGDRTFTDVTSGSGVGAARRGVENHAADLNNDGFLDVSSNGSLLFGNGDLTFKLVDSPSKGSLGDINNDGFLDMFNGLVFKNNANANNWIKIVTIGDQAGGNSNINGIGAWVEIKTAQSTQVREVRSGTGFSYMSTLNTHFGIGTEEAIEYVRVYWPSGVVDNIMNPTINQALIINEGQSLSIDSNTLEQVLIYPVPTRNILNFKFGNNDFLNSNLVITDMSGKQILNSKLTSNSIDVSSLSSGYYILRISNDNGIITKKFAKY